MSAPYKDLGDELLSALGDAKSQTWLAKQTFVSREAVHYWVSGQSRPEPGRLGQVAALLKLEPQRLARLAGYDIEPTALEKVLDAHEMHWGD